MLGLSSFFLFISFLHVFLNLTKTSANSSGGKEGKFMEHFHSKYVSKQFAILISLVKQSWELESYFYPQLSLLLFFIPKSGRFQLNPTWQCHPDFISMKLWYNDNLARAVARSGGEDGFCICICIWVWYNGNLVRGLVRSGRKRV